MILQGPVVCVHLRTPGFIETASVSLPELFIALPAHMFGRNEIVGKTHCTWLVPYIERIYPNGVTPPTNPGFMIELDQSKSVRYEDLDIIEQGKIANNQIILDETRFKYNLVMMVGEPMVIDDSLLFPIMNHKITFDSEISDFVSTMRAEAQGHNATIPDRNVPVESRDDSVDLQMESGEDENESDLVVVDGAEGAVNVQVESGEGVIGAAETVVAP